MSRESGLASKSAAQVLLLAIQNTEATARLSCLLYVSSNGSFSVSLSSNSLHQYCSTWASANGLMERIWRRGTWNNEGHEKNNPDWKTLRRKQTWTKKRGVGKDKGKKSMGQKLVKEMKKDWSNRPCGTAQVVYPFQKDSLQNTWEPSHFYACWNSCLSCIQVCSDCKRISFNRIFLFGVQPLIMFSQGKTK